jgi:hypothetical protein
MRERDLFPTNYAKIEATSIKIHDGLFYIIVIIYYFLLLCLYNDQAG